MVKKDNKNKVEVEKKIKEFESLRDKHGWKLMSSSRAYSMWENSYTKFSDEVKRIEEMLKGVQDRNDDEQQDVQRANEAVADLDNDIEETRKEIERALSSWEYFFLEKPGSTELVLSAVILVISFATFYHACNSPTAKEIATANREELSKLLTPFSSRKEGLSIQRNEYLRVYFASGGSDIDDNVAENLRDAAVRFSESSPFCTIITSYADSTGEREFNDDLLDLRIRAVKKALSIGEPNSVIGVKGGILVAPPFKSKDQLNRWKRWARRADITFYNQACDEVIVSDAVYVPISEGVGR